MRQDGTKVIHVNFTSAKVDEIYFPQLEVVGDIANAVWQIKEGIHAQKHWDFSSFLSLKKQLDAHIDAEKNDKRSPLLPGRIVADVRSAMPEDGIVTLDNGMYKLWFARNYRAYQPNTLLLDNALATMGAGLPSAIAARFVFSDRKIVAICGDGGFMMNSQELETAVRLGQNLVVIILRDNGFGMIQWKQEAMHFPSFGLTYGNPDFVRYAESYGASGYRVTKANEFKEILSSCLERKGVHVIEVPIDYSGNYRVFTKELQNKVCAL